MAWSWFCALPLIAAGVQFSSVTQSCPTLCDPMNGSMPGLPVHHQLSGVHSDSRPSSLWCHPAISSSIVPFSSCPQSLPASESFPMSQLFAWGGQSIGVSALASVLPMNIQDWSLEWTGWISLQSKGLSRVFANTTVQKHLQNSPEVWILIPMILWTFLRIPPQIKSVSCGSFSFTTLEMCSCGDKV